MDSKDDLERLNRQLNELISRQNEITNDIKQLRVEIRTLEDKGPGQAQRIEIKKDLLEKQRPAPPPPKAAATKPRVQPRRRASALSRFMEETNMEQFIGENLINKVGILVTIIGVVIGAKYIIDNDLVGPAMRIILGYVLAIGLLAFGFRLKEKYRNYSAVLVSGALAIMYFLTYAAFDFYALIPAYLAFILMVLWTAFGVAVAIYFASEVISVIGLVGAYAIPFLLSPEEGNSVVLFSYITIINIGVLIIAYGKSWRILKYTAYLFTWVIFLTWFTGAQANSADPWVALGFSFGFFLTFYAIFLSHILLQGHKFNNVNIVLILLNSFIFFGITYISVSMLVKGSDFLGLMTIAHALVHLVVAILVRQNKYQDKRLFNFTLVLVLTFLTIAVPMQLKGNWTTILWAAEAVVLLWMGRTQKVDLFETLAYPIIVIAFGALLVSWGEYSDVIYGGSSTTPILNPYFLTTLIFLGAVIFVNHMFNSGKKASILFNNELVDIIPYVLPAIILFTAYVGLLKEINLYWENVVRSFRSGQDSEALGRWVINNLEAVWIIIYTMAFTTGVALLNQFKLRKDSFTMVARVLLVISIFVFLTAGLFVLSELRQSYLNPEVTVYLQDSIFNIIIRYIAVVFFAIGLYVLSRYQSAEGPILRFKMIDVFIHGAILWFASSELIHWLAMAGMPGSYKIWLSILWGAYSLFLIAWGIRSKRRHLRIMAIVIFGLTLLKLAAYDIESLNAVRKTIVFVALGLILLVASFLYNKYKDLIYDSDDP